MQNVYNVHVDKPFRFILHCYYLIHVGPITLLLDLFSFASTFSPSADIPLYTPHKSISTHNLYVVFLRFPIASLIPSLWSTLIPFVRLTAYYITMLRAFNYYTEKCYTLRLSSFLWTFQMYIIYYFFRVIQLKPLTHPYNYYFIYYLAKRFECCFA